MEPHQIEYANYWETESFFDAVEFCSWDYEKTLSSSPDMAAESTSSTLPKNIMAERERRKKFNKTLYDLRSVVPNITKMNKTSVILDAINYIQELQEQERSLVEEISELESPKQITAPPHGIKDEDLLHAQMQRRRAASMSPIEAMEVSVAEIGNGISLVSITCNKKWNAIVMVLEVIESLDLTIITANITSSFGKVFLSLVIQLQQLSEGGLIVPVEGIGHTPELVNPHGSGIGGIVGECRGRRRRRRVLKP
ncbi:unnamed protein product [Musa acuminata subsp. burmannicoides]